MIFTERTITIRNDSSSMNAPVVLYRGDKNVEVRFTLVESPYKYSNRDSINIIESTNASYAQLVIKTPNDRDPIFGDITAVGQSNVVFIIGYDMIDEIEEVGTYSFQIRLFDADQTSMVTIPEVVGGFIIREPIAKEDTNNNITNSAIVGSAVVTNDLEIPTFVGSSYNKTAWHDGDVISKQKLDKMEDGIYETYELSKVNNSQIKDIANISLTKHTDGKVYIKKQDGTLIGTGIEISGGNADLSKITMSMDGQTLKLMNDGVQIATVEIPTAVVTDEQLTSIIQSKIDDGTLSSIALGDNSVATKNIQDGAITPNKTTFFNEINNNLLSGKTITKVGNNLNVEEYIKVNTNTLYLETQQIYSGIFRSITCYDAKYNSLGTTTASVISSTDGYYIYMASLLDNTSYVKVVFNAINVSLEQIQDAYMKDTKIVHGEKQKTFSIVDNYKTYIYDELKIEENMNSSIQAHLENSSASKIKIKTDKYLIGNLSDILNGRPITIAGTLDTGEVISSNGYMSEYINYTSTDIFICSSSSGGNITKIKIFCYDSSKTLLENISSTDKGFNSNVNYRKITLPDNTAYIRIFSTSIFAAYIRSSMLIDIDQETLLENSKYVPVVKKSPFSYISQDSCVLCNGDFNTDITGNCIPYIIKNDGYTEIYVKFYPKGYYGGTMKFTLLDETMQVISTVEADKVLYNEATSNASTRVVITHVNLPKTAAYILIKFNINDLPIDRLYRTIISSQYPPESEDIDSTNYSYLENKEILSYIQNNLTRDIQDDCYKFAKIGRLIERDSTFKYVCWSTDLMHYDSSINKFVQIIKTSTAHGGSEDCGFISYIDPVTLESTPPAKMYITSDNSNWAKWLNGFVIDGDGNYLVWYYDYENTPRQMHRIISTDKGATWTDNGACTMPTETGYFQQVTKLSSGTLLGSYDDGTIPTSSSTKTITKVARSTDNGLTWTDVEITSTYFSVEQHFLEIDDTIMLIGRKNAYGSTKTPATVAYSTDDGLTWTTEKESKSITMHCGDAVSFIHDGIVEVFANTRYYKNTFRIEPFIGELNHYIASKEDALQDKFILVEKFYIPGTDSASFHGPSLAQDLEGNVLISYSSDVPTGDLPSDLYFLYSTGRAGCRPVCCDGTSTDTLPYSGSKVESLIKSLNDRIAALESNQ